MLTVNQIQYFSLHDGPGIRTTVFMQGCNLRCKWCHNPETWSNSPAIIYNDKKCLQCKSCEKECPVHAHSFINGMHLFERNVCINCRKCIEVCCTDALKANGKQYSESELLKDLMRDQQLYEISDGGITFSGGEPLLWLKSLKSLCELLHKNKIHIAVETALNVPISMIKEAVDYFDLFLVDCKLIDKEKHKTYTGKSNKETLNGIRYLAGKKEMEIRIPVIGNVNDDCENAEKTAEFLEPLCNNIKCVELLPYHDYGISKAAYVGIEQERFSVPPEEKMIELESIYQHHNLNVRFTVK